jgi:hypothetical protein
MALERQIALPSQIVGETAMALERQFALPSQTGMALKKEIASVTATALKSQTVRETGMVSKKEIASGSKGDRHKSAQPPQRPKSGSIRS